jgi:transcriptional regulator with XRE-family HTH domain
MQPLNFMKNEISQVHDLEIGFIAGVWDHYLMTNLTPIRPETVAERLKVTREALGYPNQKDFYAPLQIGPSAYSMWESGKQFPSVTNAALLCQEYGLTLDWIFLGDVASLPEKIAIKIRVRMTANVSDRETRDFISNEKTD